MTWNSLRWIACTGLGLAAALGLPVSGRAAPISVKLVLVTDIDPPAPRDKAGLFQTWIAREHLDEAVLVPGVKVPVRVNRAGEVGLVTGVGAGAAAQIAALGMDPRFDFSHAYWLVGGMASASPELASVGSVAWAQYVVDGDNEAYEMDRADAPPDWPYGIVPLGVTAPKASPWHGPKEQRPPVTTLNRALARLAYSLSSNLTLPDIKTVRTYRAGFAGFNAGAKPPFVLLGDVIGSSRFWHGKTMEQWAADWVQYATDSHGRFVMADTSDHAIMAGLATLDRAGKVDLARVLVMRAASNYTVASPNQAHDPAYESGYQGYELAVAAADVASNPIVREIVDHWDQYAAAAPAVPVPPKTP